jgi:small ligand-binding sensory domain FIST
VPFASSLSEHPVATEATGEVSGAVLEALGDRPDLAVVVATRPHAGALEDIVGTVSSVLHPLAVMGGIAQSAIGAGREVEDTAAISLWAGRVGQLIPLSLNATRLADDSWHFDGWPSGIDLEPSVLVLLADPFTFPAGEFLGWLEGTRPELPVIGGNLSGGRGPGGTRLVLGDRLFTSGAVGVLIGAGVDVELLVSQGSRGFGHPFTVTRSDRNVIYEVAGIPAMDCLVEQIKNGLGPAEVAGIEANGLLVGRLVDEHVEAPGAGDYFMLNVVGADRATGALAVDHRVPLGSTVRFHRRDAETAHGELELLLHGRRAQSALVFTCNGRGTRLFDAADHDAAMVEGALGPVPVGGFFAAGEIGPIGGRNFVHGFTASMALFRDR